MMLKKFKKLFVVLFLVFASFGLASCGEKDGSGTTGTTGSTPSGSTKEPFTPVTIDHAYGKTTISKKPQRIATLRFGNQDIVLALGVVPVGFSAANFGVEDGTGLLPWTKQALTLLGENNPNVFNDIAGTDLEAVAACRPDLILAPYSDLSKSEYDTLSLIAPVVAYATSAWTIEWREWVRITAKAMGEVAKGEALILETENLITTKAAAHPIIKDKKVIWTSFRIKDLSKVSTYTPTDARGAFLLALGLDYPASYYAQFTDLTKYSLSLSSDYANILDDADLLIGYGNLETWDAVKAHAIWKEMKPIKNNAIAMLGDGGYLAASGTPTPLSIRYTVDEYLSLISQALQNNQV